MKKKVKDIVVDIILIAIVFAITDYLMLTVFESDNLWLEVGIYIVFYGIFFGSKSGIVYLIKKHKEIQNNNIPTESSDEK